MSAPTTTAASITDKNLDAACAAVATEIGRTDGKASLLLAFNGASLAGLATLADVPLPTPARVLGALAVTAIGCATVLLLLVVRPRLSGQDRASFPHWARLAETEVHASMAGDTRAARIRTLSNHRGRQVHETSPRRRLHPRRPGLPRPGRDQHPALARPRNGA
jgi:hypothetical protein